MSKKIVPAISLAIGMLVLSSTGHLLLINPASADGGEVSCQLKKLPEEAGSVLRLDDGKVICQAASDLDTQSDFSPRQYLTVQGTGNITFIVRAGAGFEASPQARDTFLRAAQIWSSLIEAPQPVTIVVDVDYTPTVLGSPSILGQARPQALIGRGEYQDYRASVITNANSGKELALFNALPESAIPTDLGDTDTFVMPSALLRVVGLIPPLADPDGELALFGPPPSIVMLSIAPWDFNPDDGITAGTFDFLGTALHEIGHLIGFFTRVGTTAINPNLPLTVSAFDICRFRPGMTMETFTTAQRILSAGGQHVHYAGEQERPLSTARLDLMGGDGFGADHWKDDSFVGSRMGVMDPQPRVAEEFGVSNNDLAALKAMGYRIIGEATGHSPFIGSLKGDLQSDSLTLTGAVYDIDADVSMVQISLLDSFGNTLREDAPVAFGNGEKVSGFTFTLIGLNALPAAVGARVSFADNAGHASEPVIAGFNLADAGGPAITSATFNGSKLLIKGKDLAGQLQVEINGAVVATRDNGSNKKAKIKGKADVLNIRDGANRLRVIRNGARSNIAVLVDGATLPENRVEFITTPRLTNDHNRAYQYRFEARSASGRAVQYEVEAPSWMNVDSVNGNLSGTAGWDNLEKSFDITIKASDGLAQAEQKFTLRVRLGEIVCETDFGDPSQSLYVLPFEVGKRFQCNQSYCPPDPRWGHHNWFAVDFEMPIGTRIVATRGGLVTFIEERYTDGNRIGGQENQVIILHDDGTVAQYAHLTKNGALVAAGDRVTQGQVIGLSGDTGASIGPHLHFNVYRGGRFVFGRQYTMPVNFKNADGRLNAQRGLIYLEWYEAKSY